MKNHYRSFLYSAVVFLAFLMPETLDAQTYASPELKTKAEKEIKAKESQPANVTGVKDNPARPKQSPFDYRKLSGMYRLQKVDAVDYTGKHTAAEMTKFQQEAKKEFETYDRAINPDSYTMYVINRKDATRHRAEPFVLEGKYLRKPDCKDCQDNRFEIVEQSSSRIILEVKPQNAGESFMYRLTFSK